MITDRPLDAIERAVADGVATALPGVVDRLAAITGPRAYSVAQVAERLDLAENTVRKLIADGHLAAIPHVSPMRVAAGELASFMAGRP